MKGRLDINVRGDRIGELLSANPNYIFTYGQQAERNSAVSLTMPVSQPAYPSGLLHPVFAQNLPEGYLGDVVKKIVSKNVYGI